MKYKHFMGVVQITFKVWSDGDDLVLPANGKMPEARLCFLRQQHTCEEKPCLCLADFIAPRTATSVPLSARYIGIFATTAGLPEDFPHDVASVYHRSEVCPCCNPQLRALRRRLTPQHRPEQGSGEEDVYEKMMRQTIFDRLAQGAQQICRSVFIVPPGGCHGRQTENIRGTNWCLAGNRILGNALALPMGELSAKLTALSALRAPLP